MTHLFNPSSYTPPHGPLILTDLSAITILSFSECHLIVIMKYADFAN